MMGAVTRPEPPPHIRRTYLLGAGFSRGFHRPMPLMADLAARVVDELGVEPDHLAVFNHDLEAWLSYLSVRQPWDDESTALRNLATFRDASAVIADEIERASSLEDDEEPVRAALLTRLALDWCLAGADILTFNYDLLVENVLRDWDRNVTGADIYPIPLTARRPAGGGGLFGYSNPTLPLPSLHKLHGSVNWLYGGIDHSDGPITLGPWYRTDPQDQEPRERYLYADLTPLVIPPTSSKSPFYGNMALRSLWADAAAALHRADELVVIGYSFPASDQQVTTLIRTALPPGKTIRVVTLDQPVADRAADAFARHKVDAFVDPDAAAAYVEHTCGQVIEWSHASDGDGVREWLTNGAVELTRMSSYDPSSPGEIAEKAMRALAKEWPGVERTWRGHHFSSEGRARYRAYVPKAAWDANPDPWRTTPAATIN